MGGRQFRRALVGQGRSGRGRRSSQIGWPGAIGPCDCAFARRCREPSRATCSSLTLACQWSTEQRNVKPDQGPPGSLFGRRDTVPTRAVAARRGRWYRKRSSWARDSVKSRVDIAFPLSHFGAMNHPVMWVMSDMVDGIKLICRRLFLSGCRSST